jgi:hypothetical protein
MFPREFGVDGEAALASRLGAQSTAEGGDAFAHPEQPDAGHRRALWRGGAVVVDLDDHGAGTVGHPDGRGVGPGMPGDVGQRLLHDPVGGAVHRGRHVAAVSLDRQGRVQTGRAGPLDKAGKVVEAQRRVLVILAQRLQRRAQLVVGTVVGMLVPATADGGPGTGNGVVGGYAGVMFGLIAVLLGGLALLRSRRRA